MVVTAVAPKYLDRRSGPGTEPAREYYSGERVRAQTLRGCERMSVRTQPRRQNHLRCRSAAFPLAPLR
eukprot:3305087-Heterocapsa_arctica.AAC.1